MMLLLKLLELILLFMLIRTAVSLFMPSMKRKKPQSEGNIKAPRFDGHGHDIADAEYEEIRK